MTRTTNFEYVSAIHMHSVYSDGSGTVDEILAAARGTGLDFLVLTDHNTVAAREAGYEGWHDGMLLAVGEEVSSRHGHCLSLGADRSVNHRQPAAGVLEDIARAGGRAYIAHPHGRYRPLMRAYNHAWKDWSADGFTGLELWSYMFDWAREFHYTRFPRFYRDPDARIAGPHPETLALYDRFCRDRRVVALGGIDAHARTYPPLPFVVFPYRDLFGTIRTHILTERPLTGDAAHDLGLLFDALGNGHAFIAFDRLADATGASFGAVDGSLGLGDEITFERTVELGVTLPVEADIRVIRDGDLLHRNTGSTFTFDAARPGVYRVEAHLDGRPWLFTNPIYLRHPRTA